MKLISGVIVALLCTVNLSCATDVSGHWPDMYAVSKQAREMAFDPNDYFNSPNNLFEGLSIGVEYIGDDGFPVWSMAASVECSDSKKDGDECPWIARMVRVPKPKGGEEDEADDYSQVWNWNDDEGRAAFHKIVDLKKHSRGFKLSDALDNIDMSWLEANMETCPGAVDKIKTADTANWLPFTPGYLESDEIIMHPDFMRVSVRAPMHHTYYTGWVGYSDTPVGWAHDLAQILEPCWKPATTTPPWRKKTNRNK